MNIRVVRKCSLGTNTLAYFAAASIMKEKGATTFSIMTLSITTLSITTISITTITIMTFSITTLSITIN